MTQSMEIVFNHRGGDVRTMDTMKHFVRFQLTLNERSSDIHLSDREVRIEGKLRSVENVQRTSSAQRELTREDLRVLNGVFFG